MIQFQLGASSSPRRLARACALGGCAALGLHSMNVAG